MRGIGAIVLAAGGSTRLGRPKQLLELNGETLVHAAVRAAQGGGCDVVCVVTGNSRDGVVQALADLCPLFAYNEGWQRGMGTSIRAGLQALPPVSAVVLLACDQPAVDATIIRALIEQRRRTGSPIVASQYAGTLGIPAIFDESCFSELQQLPDNRGAKLVIEADSTRVTPMDFPGGARDLDTIEDVRRWIADAETTARSASDSQTGVQVPMRD